MDKQKKNDSKIKKIAKKISEIWQESNSEFSQDISSDILGSYTGTAKDGSFEPEQDADDL
ncbi:MAG: hypothetical protein EOM05_00880 [Clostridia bacterium]|nr:hypothetical protein [Clostridia bacterium]